MIGRLLESLVLVSLLVGCAQRPMAPARATWTPIPYDESEYASLAKAGTGVVRGQVFATTVGGDVKKGAGRSVILMPATTFRDQWHRETFETHNVLAASADKRHLQYDRTKVADGDGRFEFADVPPGKYYVLSDITWQTAGDIQFARETGFRDQQGGLVVRRIEVRNGSVTEAMLTR